LSERFYIYVKKRKLQSVFRS